MPVIKKFRAKIRQSAYDKAQEFAVTLYQAHYQCVEIKAHEIWHGVVTGREFSFPKRG